MAVREARLSYGFSASLNGPLMFRPPRQFALSFLRAGYRSAVALGSEGWIRCYCRRSFYWEVNICLQKILYCHKNLQGLQGWSHRSHKPGCLGSTPRCSIELEKACFFVMSSELLCGKARLLGHSFVILSGFHKVFMWMRIM